MKDGTCVYMWRSVRTPPLFLGYLSFCFFTAFPQIQHAVHSVREGYSRAECKISAFVIRPCPDNLLMSTVISISIVSIKLSISLPLLFSYLFIHLFILYLNSLPPSWTPKETFLRRLSKHSILHRHASRQS